MVKEFVVKYGKDTYKRNAMTGDSLDYLGLRFLPKVIGFGTTINAMISRHDIENENHYSLYQCIKDIFSAEDWKWLVDEILYNFEQPMAVGERYFTNEEEVNEHFAGDFIKKYTVVLQFAYKNLGEFKELMPSLNGLVGNIVSCLEKVAIAYMKEAEQSINSYGNNLKQTKKTTNKQEKK
jgi:hypothetical protein